jgi:hypothetical protein
METFFARHTLELDIDEKTRERLWEGRRIAIHFPHDKEGRLRGKDNRSLRLSDYAGSARRAMRALLTLSKNGGYMCAEHHPHQECIVGYVRPNSRVELLRGMWGSAHGLQKRKAILKSVKLEKVKIMHRRDLALILVGRPRQGTIMRWPSAKDSIENIVEGKRTKPSFDRLSPDQQEIMCSEFLRCEKFEQIGPVPYSRLAHLLLPVGRSMRDIDVCGVTMSGKNLFAQVTFHKIGSKEAKAKIATLSDYGDDGLNILILFCDCNDVLQEGPVRVIPIRWVYEYFVSTAIGQVWLDKAVMPLSLVG